MLKCNPRLPTPLLPPEPYLLISSSFSHPAPTQNASKGATWEFENIPMEVAEETIDSQTPFAKAIPSHHFLEECFHDAFYDYDEKTLGLVMLKAGSGRKQQARIRPLYPAAVYPQRAGSTFQWVPGQCLALAPRGAPLLLETAWTFARKDL